jgi:transcriptional regulator with XRE-family HTH domain
MKHNLNVIGKNVAKFRRQRGWTQEELAARLQLLGWNVTSQFLANIETGRCVVTDAQILFFSEAFRISAEDLFPPKSQSLNGTE